MRRIIERVVTVVTTTTWKISWEPDSSHADHSVDPVTNDLPSSNVLSEAVYDTQASSPVIETKEDDPSERETKKTDHIEQEPLKESYSYPKKSKGNQNHEH